MQHITLEGVKAACRKAYKARALGAQAPRPAMKDRNRFVNAEGPQDFRCAIGCALSASTLDKITLSANNGALIDGIRDFVTWPQEDYYGLAALQSRHDAWANLNCSTGPSLVNGQERARQRFVTAIK